MIAAVARPLTGNRFTFNRADGWPAGVYAALKHAGIEVAPPVTPLVTWDPFCGVDHSEFLRLRAVLTPASVARAASIGVFLTPEGS